MSKHLKVLEEAGLVVRGSGTDLLIRHEQLTAPGAAERHAAGWQGAVDQLIALVSDAPESASGRLSLAGRLE